MIKCIRYSIFVTSIAVFFLGALFNNFNVVFIGSMCMLFHNIIFCIEKIKNRVLLLVFNIMVFVFLMGRPLVNMLKGEQWWYFEEKTVYFALGSVYISLICLFLGALWIEWLMRKKNQNPNYCTPPTESYQNFIDALQKITHVLFYITMACYLIMELEKLIYMHGKEYVDFYLGFETQLPLFIRAVGGMMKPVLCIYLATLPSKNKTFIPLVLYCASAVPMLIIGLRNPIVLNVLFAFCYYCIREIFLEKESKRRWLGKFEKTAIVIAIPIAIVFLSVLNLTREGKSAASLSFFSSIVDFIYLQGVSFDVLCIGYDAIPKLPPGNKCYTFGGFIDYTTQSTLGQAVLKAPFLGSGNTKEKALYGNSFAHSMSYVAKDDYLEGHGWGSSYILETYADFGFIGIILFSILIGALLVYMLVLIRKHWLWGTIVMYSLMGIFFIPRDAATGWLTFLITPQFISITVFCGLLAGLCVKRYTLPSVNREIYLKRIQRN